MADTSFIQGLKEGINSIQQNAGLPKHLLDITETLARIYNTILAIAGVLFMLMFFFGALTYLTAAGNEDSTTKARRMMIDSVIGLILTLAAYAITKFVLKALGYELPS